jgi:hypothetical protein
VSSTDLQVKCRSADDLEYIGSGGLLLQRLTQLITLILVLLHVLGVAAASIAHRENLVWARENAERDKLGICFAGAYQVNVTNWPGAFFSMLLIL